jgi:small-conductance mechanosensitive channel
MLRWEDIWHTEVLFNSIGAWTLALAAFLVTFTVLPLIKGYISSRRRKWLQSGRGLPTPIQIATLLVSCTSRLFLWTVALYFALHQLTFPARIERVFDILIVLTFWMQVGIWAMKVVRFAVDRRMNRTERPDPALAGSIDIIVFIAGLIIWTMAFLLALDNLGVQIKPLLAGLGISGIAVALAVQTILGDLLASMSIALDKPFTVGDALQVDDINGTVEHITVRSTRLRSLSGEQIIIANNDLLKSRIRNYGRMQQRRAVFNIIVSYDTPAEKLRAIPPMVKEIIEAQPETRFDRSHLLTYGQYGLQFETVFFMTTSDYNKYADTQQTINIEIVKRLKEMDVALAVTPHQRLPLQPPPPEAANAPASG